MSNKRGKKEKRTKSKSKGKGSKIEEAETPAAAATSTDQVGPSTSKPNLKTGTGTITINFDEDTSVVSDSLRGKPYSSLKVPSGPKRPPVVPKKAELRTSILSATPQLKPVQVGLDLGEIPSNYFRFEKDWNARVFSHKVPSGFSSFAVAQDQERFVGPTDFISDAENIKKLIKLPFSTESVSLVMHRVGNSILIDNYDLSMLFMRCKKEHLHWEWFINYATDKVSTQKNVLLWEGRSSQQINSNHMLHKLFYYSLAEDMKFKSETVAKDSRTACLTQPPDYGLMGSKTKFLQKMTWDFAGYSFLVGSDVPTFKNETEYITIRENDAEAFKSIPKLDGLDAWIDNQMLNASETLFCHHKDDKVLKTEFIRTQKLERDYEVEMATEKSKKLFEVLKAKVCEVGHTYWFYRAPGGDVFEIIDLTLASKPLPGESVKKNLNPFIPAVGTLLYRICERGSNYMPPSTVLKMMKHFVSIYPEEQYPWLALSALYVVLHSRLDYDSNIYQPEIRLLNEGPKDPSDGIIFDYDWNEDNYDIFCLQYVEDSDLPKDLEIFNDFQAQPGDTMWKAILEDQKKQMFLERPESKLHLIFDCKTEEDPRRKRLRRSLNPEFIPEDLSCPGRVKSIHEKMKPKPGKTTPDASEYISTFTSNLAAYAASIQKPSLTSTSNEVEDAKIPTSMNQMSGSKARDTFFRKLKARYQSEPSSALTTKSKTEPGNSAPVLPMEWIFYQTCKDLFRLFSTAFCILDDLITAKEKGNVNRKPTTLQQDQNIRADFYKLFRRKLALLFLSIAYFSHTRTPPKPIPGRFFAKLALFLSTEGDHGSSTSSLTSSAWKIGTDLLGLVIQSKCTNLEYKTMYQAFKETMSHEFPDLDFVYQLSQRNRKVTLDPNIKHYEDFPNKSTVLSAMLTGYNMAVNSAPPKFKEFVGQKTTESAIQAVKESFQQCQGLGFGAVLADVSHTKESIDAANKVDAIIDTLDSILSSCPHKESYVHDIRIRIFKAEVYLWFNSYFKFKVVKHADKVETFMQMKNVLEEAIFSQGPPLPRIFEDEVKWMLSCIEWELADCIFLQTKIHGSEKTFQTNTLHTLRLDEILELLKNSEQHIREPNAFPSRGRQRLHLARIHESRAVVWLTYAQLYGWTPDPEGHLEIMRKEPIYSSWTNLFKINKMADPVKNDAVYLKSHDLMKIYLNKAADEFMKESTIRLELGCLVEFLRARLFCAECRRESFDEREKSQYELISIIDMRKYMHMYKIGTDRDMTTVGISTYKLPGISSQVQAYQIDSLMTGRRKNVSIWEMLTRLSKKLSRRFEETVENMSIPPPPKCFDEANENMHKLMNGSNQSEPHEYLQHTSFCIDLIQNALQKYQLWVVKGGLMYSNRNNGSKTNAESEALRNEGGAGDGPHLTLY